jgi:thiamine-phosphate pyrophosphorylase
MAAASRATEALRVLEEVAKVGSMPPPLPQAKSQGSASVLLEQLRYRVYAAAGSVSAKLGTGVAPQWSLCVLISASACTHHGWERVAELACEGGADCLQLREKDLPDRELLERAMRLREITREHGVSCVINDRPDIALLVGADGVHVGQDDLPVEVLRRLSGSRLLIGVSTANLEQAREAVMHGADVCGVGPMFHSGTKPKETLAGPEYLRAYLNDPVLARVPHLAISGITPERAGELREMGCRGVAVCAQVCGVADPRKAASELLEAVRGSSA